MAKGLTNVKMYRCADMLNLILDSCFFPIDEGVRHLIVNRNPLESGGRIVSVCINVVLNIFFLC